MARLKVTQLRSVIKAQGRQKRTLQALGLRGRHHSVTHDDTPVVRGMLDKVRHMIQIEEVSE